MRILLLIAALASSARADELTLHVYPSSFGIDWASPGSLARSAALNSLPDLVARDGTPIGHVTVEIGCGAGAKDTARRVVTGMTQSDAAESRRELGRGVGLGILFHDFKGRLEDAPRVEERLRRRAASGSVSFVTFRLAPKACRRLVRYFDEYQARGYGAHYGLPHRPLHREGSGCSAFGASFLAAAGLLSPELIRAWSRTISVPLRLVGGPLTGGSVSLRSLLFSRGDRWADGAEPAKTVHFYDPDAIHRWIAAKVKAGEAGYEVATLGKSAGIVFDATKAPVPSGPVWKAP